MRWAIVLRLALMGAVASSCGRSPSGAQEGKQALSSSLPLVRLAQAPPGSRIAQVDPQTFILRANLDHLAGGKEMLYPLNQGTLDARMLENHSLAGVVSVINAHRKNAGSSASTRVEFELAPDTPFGTVHDVVHSAVGAGSHPLLLVVEVGEARERRWIEIQPGAPASPVVVDVELRPGKGRIRLARRDPQHPEGAAQVQWRREVPLGELKRTLETLAKERSELHTGTGELTLRVAATDEIPFRQVAHALADGMQVFERSEPSLMLAPLEHVHLNWDGSD